MKTLFIGAAAVAAFVCSAVVFAKAPAGNTEARAVAVYYGDVNAHSAQGADTLYARLKSAAKGACGTAPGRDLDAIVDFNACRADALAKAVNDVNSKTLTALHRASISPIELARFDRAITAG